LQMANINNGYYSAKLIYRQDPKNEWQVFAVQLNDNIIGNRPQKLKEQEKASRIFELSSKARSGVDFSRHEIIHGTAAYVTVGKSEGKKVRFTVYTFNDVSEIRLEPLDYESLSSLVTAIKDIK